MNRQLPLNIQLIDTATFANFFSGPNQAVVKHLQDLLLLKSYPIIYLWGPVGTGRSHLLQACCHMAQELQLTATYIPLLEHSQWSPAIFENLEQCNLVCLDDIDCLAGLPEWEEACFNLYNRIQIAGQCLIIAAEKAPRLLELGLADLTSRLNGALVLRLQALSDDEKLTALKLRAQNRGLNLTDEVSRFLLLRCPRNMQELFTALEKLDQASLIAKRRLTIPFVKEILSL